MRRMHNLKCVKCSQPVPNLGEKRQAVLNTFTIKSEIIVLSGKSLVHTAGMCEMYKYMLLFHVIPLRVKLRWMEAGDNTHVQCINHKAGVETEAKAGFRFQNTL